MRRAFLRVILIAILLAAPAAADPPAQEERIRHLRALRDNLALFLSGEKPVDVPASSLFSVDLADEDAVRRRIDELRGSALPDGPPPQGAAAPVGANGEIRALEREVSTHRLRFLSLPRDTRAAILAAQGTILQQSEKAVRLARERTTAEEERGDAARSAEEAEAQAREGRSAALRELASRRALLEKTREELAALQVRWTAALEERNRFYRETAHEISSLAAASARPEDAGQARENLERISGIWRGLVDQVFTRLAPPEIADPLPEIPPPDMGLLRSLPAEDRPDGDTYLSAHDKVTDLHRSLLRLRESRYEEERDHLYRLLLQSGELRSRLLQEYLRSDGSVWIRKPGETLGDLFREVRIVPYRVIAITYARLVDFRGKAATGYDGMADIFRQLIFLLVLLAVPYGTYRVLAELRSGIDRGRARLLAMRHRYPLAGSAALLLRRVSPYFPWIVMLLGVFLAEALLDGTDLAEIGQFLPYASFYIGYRIFLILGTSLFAMLDGRADGERVRSSVRRIGLFFLAGVSALHATEMAAGKALAYDIARGLLLYVGTLALFATARGWRREIGGMAAREFPEAGKRLERLCSGNAASWVVCFPVLLLLALSRAARRVMEWAFRFDLFKRAGAELFRRRLEGTAERAGRGGGKAETPPARLPEEYLRWFDLHAPPPEQALVRPEEWVAPRLRSMIEDWATGNSEEHSVMIYGDKGCGKTTLLRTFAPSLPVERVIHVPLPSRMRKRKDILEFFGKHLGVSLEDGPAALSRAFTGAKKTVVLMDDTQNLFVGALGGFEGYRTLGDLVTAPTDSLFWVAAINRRSWEYLDGVYGKNHCFRRVFETPAWPDTEIRQLILSRHGLSGLRISYEDIIGAVQSVTEESAVAQLEEQFFRLLWRESRGNPRAAMVLWLSALACDPDGSLRVGIPRHQEYQSLETAGDDTLFVFAAIIRHENLTLEEIVEAVNLPERVVRHAVRIGVEKGAIARFPDGRFRVTPEAQFALNQFLERRNFLYG